MRQTIIRVLYNREILPTYYRLGLEAPLSWKGYLSDLQPGQFVMLRLGDMDPLLRRPFGVYKFLGQGIEILYKVVGKGTAIMSRLKEGDEIDVLGPLGRPFPLLDGYNNIIMVAGGVGIVPFYLLGVRYKTSGVRPRLLFGGRDKEDLPGLEDFQKLGIETTISTEDGSMGQKGLVTELLKKELSRMGPSLVYACGPKGMLRAVAHMAQKTGVTCYVSLDRVMACGIGACLGCAVKTRGPLTPEPSYKMVCKDGPVFDARDIVWEEI